MDEIELLDRALSKACEELTRYAGYTGHGVSSWREKFLKKVWGSKPRPTSVQQLIDGVAEQDRTRSLMAEDVQPGQEWADAEGHLWLVIEATYYGGSPPDSDTSWSSVKVIEWEGPLDLPESERKRRQRNYYGYYDGSERYP